MVVCTDWWADLVGCQSLHHIMQKKIKRRYACVFSRYVSSFSVFLYHRITNNTHKGETDVDEIARFLGGENITETTRKSAKELLALTKQKSQ